MLDSWTDTIFLFSLGRAPGFLLRTDTDVDEVWAECQGKYRTGTDMDVVWEE